MFVCLFVCSVCISKLKRLVWKLTPRMFEARIRVSMDVWMYGYMDIWIYTYNDEVVFQY